MDLAQLQNLIKRDPQGYKDDFLLQFRHFQTQYEIFLHKPTKDAAASKPFADLVSFLSAVATCFPAELADFPTKLMELLQQKYNLLGSELRRALVKSLILMQNRNLFDQKATIDLFRLFFQLFRCHDKPLRKLLFHHIVTDIKKANLKHKNNSLNRALQNFMYPMIQDEHEIAAKKSLQIMIELYRRNIWNDAKTVNVISLGCISRSSKLRVIALRFFLTSSNKLQKGSGSDSDGNNSDSQNPADTAEKIRRLKHRFERNKKSTARKHKMNKVMKKLNAELSEKRDGNKNATPNFAAIDLIHDPHGFAEKLLGVLKHTNEKFEVRLMIMNLISRLIARHQLLLLSFYSLLQKYLEPHQEHITYILAVLAQSFHSLVPPEFVEPVLKTLMDRFVADYRPEEVIAIGLNTIREICVRVPFAMNAEMLNDLAGFSRSHKDKGVVMAAKSLVNLYREIDPLMLSRKDRPRMNAEDRANAAAAPRLQYGASNAATGVEGIDLLEQYEQLKQEGLDGEVDEEEMVQGEELDAQEEVEEVGEEEMKDDSEQEGNSDGEDINEWGDIEFEELEELEEDEDGEEQATSEGEDEGRGGEEEIEGEEAVEEQRGREKEILQQEQVEETRSEKSTVSASSATSGMSTSTTSRRRLDSERILTEEDFEKIRKLKELQKREKLSKAARKRKLEELTADLDEEEEDQGGEGEFVSPSAIAYQRKRRRTLEERLATVLEGRADRGRYGLRKEKLGGSTTNKEKQRNKPFMLLRASRAVRAKVFRSIRDKQKARKLGQLKAERSRKTKVRLR